jgi:hypothetical protein
LLERILGPTIEGSRAFQKSGGAGARSIRESAAENTLCFELERVSDMEWIVVAVKNQISPKARSLMAFDMHRE